MVPRSKTNILPLSLKFLPLLSGIQTGFHCLCALYFVFLSPIIHLIWQLYLTWEHWPKSQWLNLLQLPFNSKCSHIKVAAHNRCKRNAATLVSRGKSAIFEHHHHPREDKGWGFWPAENMKVEQKNKEMPTCVVVSHSP